MRKYLFSITVVVFILILGVSFAGTSDLDKLSKESLETFNALPPTIQAETLKRLQKMPNYDPERTHLDSTGHFFIVEDTLEKIFADNGLEVPSPYPTVKKVISDNPPSGFTSEGIPIFHSFPGSPNVIYLNFVGQTITGTAWNNSNNPSYIAQRYIPKAYNPNRVPGFPSAVQQAIAGIWARVAEDYAPWQIDVTTQAPASFTSRTAVALITENITVDGKPMPASGSGGIAYLDVFGFSNYAFYRPALIYYNNLSDGDEDVVAEAVSHELGHNFGLDHNGIVGGSSYWVGTGSGEISWGCIMGGAYFKTVTKFCNGDYPQANNQEDQVAIITSHVPFRNPSAGNTIATATPLTITNGAFKFSGIIQNYTTSNFFSLTNSGGTISVSANTYRAKVDTLGNNVCLSLRLYDGSGNVITTSSNPRSCSATLTVNNLPIGRYFLEVYPVGNSITPFSVYGSMGQYDLIGTSSTGTLSLSPQYTTLALRSTMTFDANDTVRVSGGIPPYKFSAILNSFTTTGTTYTYIASKPGLDTIKVTDSKGNTASARVTVSQVDFGGMYGNSKVGNYNNPITGTFGCPAGYTSQIIMGTTNVDYPLYYCYRIHANGIPANYDFGGIYSGAGSGTRLNSVTRAASCPSGYTAKQIYGESTHNPDYTVIFCYKVHSESVAEAASFAGMYAPAAFTSYHNPLTGGLSCPAGTVSTKMLDTTNIDYPFFFCTYPSTLRIAPQFTNMALNNTMTFDAYDTVHVVGGLPPYTYSTNLGTFTRSGNTYTYTASKPGVAMVKVTDSKGNTASARVTVGFMDFGGMYGNSKVGNYNNPITGSFTCPSGYLSQQVMGTSGLDYPLYYCYRMHATGVPANFDFGGMYSYSSAGLRANPLTGSASCPSGYTSAQIYGHSSNSPDYPAYMCYKAHNESVAELAHFGGMYAPAAFTTYNNPATGAQSCRSGWLSSKMLDTYYVDYSLYFCY